MSKCVCSNRVPADSAAHTACINCHGEIFWNPPPRFDNSIPVLFTLEDIRKFCLQYDKMYDTYPESWMEGQAIYQFICKKLDPGLQFNSNDNDIWEEGVRNA